MLPLTIIKDFIRKSLIDPFPKKDKFWETWEKVERLSEERLNNNDICTINKVYPNYKPCRYSKVHTKLMGIRLIPLHCITCKFLKRDNYNYYTPPALD